MLGFILLLIIADIYSLIKVGEIIGVFETVAILFGMAIIGIGLTRAQGTQILTKMGNTINQRQIPGKELMEGAMVLSGGILLIFPGFVSDILGLLLLFPPTRKLFLYLALIYFRKRAQSSRWQVNTYSNYEGTQSYHSDQENDDEIYTYSDDTNRYDIIEPIPLPKSQEETEEDKKEEE